MLIAKILRLNLNVELMILFSAPTAERLEGLVGLQSTYNLKSTAARIVGASGDAWTSTVTIDKGSADGLSINMPVTSSAGVIGQIIEVSAKTSTVRLIGDENSGVSAMVQDTRAQSCGLVAQSCLLPRLCLA